MEIKLLDNGYKKIITARGTSFIVGAAQHYETLVTKITHVIGDPQEGIPAGFRVEFENGDIVEVDDVVESWYRND